MIYYSSGEILWSILFAVAYGIVYACALAVIKSFEDIISKFIHNIGKVMNAEKRNSIILKNIATAITIVTFTAGYILISYHTLDGEHRIYILLISGIFFKLTYSLANKIITRVLNIILKPISFLFNGVSKVVKLAIMWRKTHKKTKKEKIC